MIIINNEMMVSLKDINTEDRLEKLYEYVKYGTILPNFSINNSNFNITSSNP